jgi:UDP-galactose transporter B1
MLEDLSGGARVLFALLGVIGAFTLHTYIIEQRLGDEFEKNKVDPTSVTLCIQSFFSVLLAILMQLISYSPKHPFNDGQRTFYWARLGFLISCSMLPIIKATPYLSSPLCQLVKTCKGPAIIIMIYFFGRSKPAKYKYYTTFFMFLGVVLYSISKSNYKHGVNDAVTGFTLAGISLLADPFVAFYHDEYKKPQPDQLTSMKLTNLWIGIWMFLYAMVSGELVSVISVLSQHHEAAKSMLIIAVSGACGQYFVTYTLSEFGAHFLSVLTSSRKFISVLLSIVFFQHQVTLIQYVGVLLVIIATIVETNMGAKAKNKEIKAADIAANKVN